MIAQATPTRFFPCFQIPTMVGLGGNEKLQERQQNRHQIHTSHIEHIIYIYMYAQTQNIEYKYQVYTIQNININIIYSMQYILYTIKCNVGLHPDCSFDSAFSGKCAFLVQKATLPDQKATFPDLGFIVLLAGGVFFFRKEVQKSSFNEQGILPSNRLKCAFLGNG